MDAIPRSLYVRWRKLWHSGLRLLLAALGAMLGIILVIGGMVIIISDGEWPTGFGSIVAGVPLAGASVGLLISLNNAPEITLCTSEADIKKFMRNFISAGSTAHIASFGLSWVRADNTMKEFLTQYVREGKHMTILAAGPTELTRDLDAQGITMLLYPKDVEDVPRFTIINMNRRGAERVAVAREGLPNHWIDIYSVKHHPQVIVNRPGKSGGSKP